MGRLFWKFFLFISLAQLAALLGVGAVIWAEDRATRRTAPEVNVHPRAVFLVGSAAATLQYGGPDALAKLLATPGEPIVYTLDESNRDLLGRNLPGALIQEANRVISAHANSPVVRRVASADGHRYLLFAPTMRTDSGDRPLQDGERRSFRFGLFRLPLVPLIATFIGSLLCAALLARYLSKPIRTLRSAFHAATSGNLSLRVAPLMAKRKDELADLGRDFDRMAAKLQGLMDSQRRLLHDVSHELRSPLSRLQIAVGLARQQPETVQASMERIERESARIDELVGELLTLARLETGAIGSLQEDIDLNELIAGIVADARFEANTTRRGITFVDQGSIVVKGQAELLHRAIENIVRNALKHTPEGTGINLELALTADGQHARVAIIDAGPGVPESELANIFQPFFRGAGTKDTSGHGLGLSIARQIIEAHGGNIRVTNRNEGGLCVEVILSIERTETASLEQTTQ